MPTSAVPQSPRKADILTQAVPGWQTALNRAVTDPAELLDLLHLPQSLVPAARRAAQLFPLRVPLGFVERMQPGDASDPLLRQVLPLAAEHDDVPGYRVDAVGDLASRRGGGLLHKYHGRALLIATGACAVHCRYCFRRHFPYAGNQAAPHDWQRALECIRNDASLQEIILSGGDPLTLNDRRLARLVTQLEAIPHVTRLRIHSRLPVVLPERIDAGFLRWFDKTRLERIVVIHANHANELDDRVAAAVKKLRDNGATVLNQSVLLRGVNDDPAVLTQLSLRLFTIGVLPYYLHLPDPVAGTAHFDVDKQQAVDIMQQTAAQLPGYLVPRLARENPGDASKQVLGFGQVLIQGDQA